MPKTKTCLKCGIEKPLDGFCKKAKSKDGYQCWCKECLKQHRKQYEKENKAYIQKQRIRYRQESKEHDRVYRQEHKEHLIKYKIQYRQEHKEQIAAQNKLYVKEHFEEWKIYAKNRDAKKLMLPHTFTVKQWNDIKQYFNNCCAYCDKETELTQEHFIPLSKGGEFTHNNILPVCRNCNSSKNNRDFFKWFPKRSFYNKKREQKILKFLNYRNGIQQLALF